MSFNPSPAVMRVKPAPTPRILVVEDEGIVAADIERTLVDLGFQVAGVCASAEEAIQRASQLPVDLVLMDIRIQGRADGIEAAQLLRTRFGVPVIFLTAHSDPDTLARAVKSEPLGYLLKPFKKRELNTTISIALARHGLEVRLREREHLLATTLQSIGEGVITTDRDGRITFLNPAAEALTGWSAREAAGRPLAEVVTLRSQSGQAVPVPVEQVLARKPASVPLATMIGRNGSRRTISDSFSPVADDGELFGTVMVFRDVTRQRELEQKSLVEDRMAALGTVAAGVAHEVNNPLTYVLANLEFSLSELSGRGDTQVAAALEDAKSGATRVARFISELKGMVRPGSATLAPVDLRKALAWAVNTTAHEWRLRARLEQQLDSVPLVDADETQLAQVFVNLIVNAAHAIEPGAADRNVITLHCGVDSSGRAIVEVKDTGTGIPPEHLKSIFSPFFTTQGELGTGMGLPICQTIIHSFGGELEVESRPGIGSTFRVTLPRAAGGLISVPKPENRAPPAHRARVLVIDDEPLVRQLVDRCLTPFHDVTQVESAAEAFALLRHGERFDVILCDLLMPNQTGLDFHRTVAEDWPQLAPRIVFVSGGSDSQVGADDLQALPNRRLDKPFNLDTLRTTIEELMEELGPAPVEGPEQTEGASVH